MKARPYLVEVRYETIGGDDSRSFDTYYGKTPEEAVAKAAEKHAYLNMGVLIVYEEAGVYDVSLDVRKRE